MILCSEVLKNMKIIGNFELIVKENNKIYQKYLNILI